MATKFCRDCGDYRPVEEFTKNARSRDGLAFYCRNHLAERSLKSREARRLKPRVQRRPPADLVIPDGYKWCADCGRVLPLADFVRTVATLTGYGAYCRFNCNGGLGQFKDDPDVLRAAADYVESYSARQAAANGPTAPTRPGAPPVGSKAGPNRRRLHPRACAQVRAKYELREADG